MPLPDKGKTKRRKGQFERADFIHNEDRDAYFCPANQELTHKTTQNKRGQVLNGYFANKSV